MAMCCCIATVSVGTTTVATGALAASVATAPVGTGALAVSVATTTVATEGFGSTVLSVAMVYREPFRGLT